MKITRGEELVSQIPAIAQHLKYFVVTSAAALAS